MPSWVQVSLRHRLLQAVNYLKEVFELLAPFLHFSPKSAPTAPVRNKILRWSVNREKMQCPTSQMAELEPKVSIYREHRKTHPTNNKYSRHCLDVLRSLSTELPTDISSSEDPEPVNRSLAQKCGWNLGQLSTAEKTVKQRPQDRAWTSAAVLLPRLCHCARCLDMHFNRAYIGWPGFWETVNGHKHKVYSE